MDILRCTLEFLWLDKKLEEELKMERDSFDEKFDFVPNWSISLSLRDVPQQLFPTYQF